MTHHLCSLFQILVLFAVALGSVPVTGNNQSKQEVDADEFVMNVTNGEILFDYDILQKAETEEEQDTEAPSLDGALKITPEINTMCCKTKWRNTSYFNNELSTTATKAVDFIDERDMTFKGNETTTIRTSTQFFLFDFFGERDWSYNTDEEFWSQITDAYESLCFSTCETLAMTPPRSRSECALCQCDQACFFYNDCCPEMYKNYPKEYETTEGFQCSPLILSQTTAITGSPSPMISFCPASNSTSLLTSQCASWQNPEAASAHWNVTRPVTDNRSLMYRNMYCAQCHGETRYTSWSMELFFSSTEKVDGLKTKEEFFQKAMTSPFSGVYYHKPDALASQTSRTCPVDDVETLIRKCNVTGLAVHIYPAVKLACDIFFLPVKYNRTQWYRNPFCLHCNTDYTWKQLEYYIDPDTKLDPFTSPLRVLLDLDGSDEPPAPAKKPRMCENGQVFDYYQDTCRNILCEDGKYPNDNGTCSSYSPISNLYGYLGCYFIYGDSDVVDQIADPFIFSYSNDFILTPIYSVTDHLNCYCDLLGLPDGLNVTFMQIGLLPPFPVNRDSVEEALTLSNSHLKDLPEVKMILQINHPNASFNIVKSPVCSPETTAQASTMLVTLSKSCPNDSFSMLTDTCVHLGGMQYTDDFLSYAPRLDPLHSSIIYLPIDQTLTCQHVSFLQHEYEFDVKAWTVTPKSTDIPISAEKVRIDFSTWNLNVCVEDLFSQTDQAKVTMSNTSSTHDLILGWLSLICTVVSILCCLVTFAVNFILRDTQTSAGINNMLLSMTTLLAQGFSQFGNEAGVHSVCVALGILTHFFWLSAVTCMTTSTFNLFYALSFPLRYQRHKGRDESLMIPYTCVILTVPCVFISAVVIHGQISEGISGYANGSICFINPGIAKQLFFGLPVGALILINIGLYVFTIVRLFRMPKVGQSANDKRNLILYTKLSVVTGAVWVFGFLYEATDILVFAYAYTITAPLIGLFIFLAFVANKRVLSLLQLSWQGSVSRSRTFRRYTSKTKSTEAA